MCHRCNVDLTVIVREAHAEVGLLDFLDEDIFLVEEEYNRGARKVAVVADTVEQVETLMHSVLNQKNMRKRDMSTYYTL